LYELDPVFSLIRDLDIDGHWEYLSRFDPTAIALLRCFRNLETLSLTDWYLRWLSAEQVSTYLGHFGETVIHLKLEGKANSESTDLHHVDLSLIVRALVSAQARIGGA